MVDTSGALSYGNDFKDFIVKNGVITAAIAITIGVSTAGFVKTFVSSVMMPAVYLVIGKLFFANVNKNLFKTITDVFGSRAEFDVLLFIQEFITWVFVVIGAYIIIEYFVRRWFLGMSPAHNTKQTPAVALTPAMAAMASPIALSPSPPVYVSSVDPNPQAHSLSYLGLNLGSH